MTPDKQSSLPITMLSLGMAAARPNTTGNEFKVVAESTETANSSYDYLTPADLGRPKEWWRGGRPGRARRKLI